MKDYKNKKYPLVKFCCRMESLSERLLLSQSNGQPKTRMVQFWCRVYSSVNISLVVIHSQVSGQTLSKVVVDMKKIFENGQAYVALSRAVSRAGLQVLNFNRSKVASHRKVIEFYKNLSSHEKESRSGQQRLNFMQTSVKSIPRAQI